MHHVDDFTTAALIDCQRKAIVEPDQLVVVSEDWRRPAEGRLRRRRRRHPQRRRRRPGSPPIEPRPARRVCASRAGVDDRFVFLSVGGIEPRKGSTFLFQAMAVLARELDPAPALVVVGGHSFQDYRQYRDDALATLPGLGLRARAATSCSPARSATPSCTSGTAAPTRWPSRRVKEGWGLAVLEAMAAELPGGVQRHRRAARVPHARRDRGA